MGDTKDIPAVMTPPFRLSFPQLAEPKENNRGKLVYSGVMLFPKDDADKLKDMKDHVRAIRDARWPNPDRRPTLRKTFKDGDEKNTRGNIPHGHAGMIAVNFTTQYPIGCVDERNRKVQGSEIATKFYGGCWCHALVKAFAYDVDGNAGISFGMDCIQFMKDDDAFSGRKDAQDVFSPLVDDDASGSTADDDADDL